MGRSVEALRKEKATVPGRRGRGLIGHPRTAVLCCHDIQRSRMSLRLARLEGCEAQFLRTQNTGWKPAKAQLAGLVHQSDEIISYILLIQQMPLHDDGRSPSGVNRRSYVEAGILTCHKAKL